MDYVLSFDENLDGIDYVVGDIHGHYEELMSELSKINFEFTKDRLFATGDLGDRGPESVKIIALVNEPWFYSVRGNHDQFIMDCFAEERVMLFGGYADIDPKANYHLVTQHESDWFFELSLEQQKEIADKLEGLPYVIQIKSNEKLIGITHAGIPEEVQSWRDLLNQLSDRDMREKLLRTRKHAIKTKEGNERGLIGVDYTIHGHSCFSVPVFGRSSAFIDTYDESGKLSVIALSSLSKTNNLQYTQVVTEALINVKNELNLSQVEIAEVLGIEECEWDKIEKAQDLMELKAFQEALVVIRIYRSLFAKMGGNSKAMAHWFRTNNTHFGESPLSYMKTAAGLESVLCYLETMNT